MTIERTGYIAYNQEPGEERPRVQTSISGN